MHLHDPLTTNEGPLSIATPGELKGYWEAHKRFGKLKWKEVMEPTLNICRNGEQFRIDVVCIYCKRYNFRLRNVQTYVRFLACKSKCQK